MYQNSDAPARRAQPPAPSPPIGALAVAGYGSILGSLFPVMAVMTIGDISGGLSVAADSAALVNTLQNIGSIAGIVIAPSFADAIGRGRTMFWTGVGFFTSSILAATAPTLPIMLGARLLHGMFGGILPLMFMLMVMTSLRPGAGRFEGMTLFATSTTLFFGIAPVIGGWISDSFGWRSLFWVQALAIIPYVAGASQVLRGERGNAAILREVDWPNYALLALGASALVLAVSEGERHFWLEAWWVTALLIGGLLASGAALRGIALTSGRPLLVLAIFRRGTFTWAILLSVFFRFGSLFAIFIVPQYLARLQGYRAADVGTVLAMMLPTTAVSLLLTYAGARRIDSRFLLSVGLGSFAVAAWLCTGLTSEWAASELRIAAGVAGFGMGFFQVAVLRFAVHGATQHDGPSVGVVFNLARVAGIVTGLAILSHVLVEREKFHSARIVENLSSIDPEASQRIATIAGAFARMSADAVNAQNAAISSLARAASGQAFTLAFGDTLFVTAVALLLGAILVWALPAIPSEANAPISSQSPGKPLSSSQESMS
jgi:MFS family permease